MPLSEVRDVKPIMTPDTERDWVGAIRSLFHGPDAEELFIPPRENPRAAPDFSGREWSAFDRF